MAPARLRALQRTRDGRGVRGARAASEPRTVTPGRRPVMDVAGVPHALIRSTSRRSDQIAACPAELGDEYVTAVDDVGEPRFLPVLSERARTKLNGMAAKMTRPPKQKACLLAQLRKKGKESAMCTSTVAVDVVNSLLERSGAAAADRARVAAAVDVALAAVGVADGEGPYHRPGRPPPTRRTSRLRIAEREARGLVCGAGRSSPTRVGRRPPRTARPGAPGTYLCVAPAMPTTPSAYRQRSLPGYGGAAARRAFPVWASTTASGRITLHMRRSGRVGGERGLQRRPGPPVRSCCCAGPEEPAGPCLLADMSEAAAGSDSRHRSCAFRVWLSRG
jgi:hypothetical protein